MPNHRPEFIPGMYYHIYNRGANKNSIFKEHSNYLFAIKKIKHYGKELNFSVISYCLMPNHYHLLVRQDGDHPAGLLPQRVFNSYSKAFNNSYSRSGTLFEGQYRIKLVEEESHLLHLCRYIHGNPVKDGLVSDPADWIYSNYQEFIGLRTGSLFDKQFFSEYFCDGIDYRNYVMEDLLSRNMPEVMRNYLEDLEGKW
ncbi:MAG: transposase [Anaerolineaceae bacterium]|nr:transposase [Anaerolineaceae bacterium]